MHPDVVEICKRLARHFEVVMTTNFDNPEIVHKLDGLLSDINISWYDQASLPVPALWSTPITLHALIYHGRLDTRQLLDEHIDRFGGVFSLKFSTLDIANKWCLLNREGSFLDLLPGERMILFNEILGQVYRGAIIKRYDKVLNPVAEQSIKFHVDGTWGRSWDRPSIQRRGNSL